MRTIATVLLVAAMGLWGCGDGSEGDGSGGPAGGGRAQASGGERGSQATGETQAPELRAEDLDRGTAEGTLGLFILHMQEGEFQEAVLLTDPESIGYEELAKAVNVLEGAKGKSSDGVSLETVMRAFMSRGWLGAVYEPLTVQDERARFEVKLVNYDPRTIDLRMVDGDWYVMAPEWVMKVKGNIEDLLPSGGGAGEGGDEAGGA